MKLKLQIVFYSIVVLSICNVEIVIAREAPEKVMQLDIEKNDYEIESFKWWNPVTSTYQTLEGQAWPKEVKDFYDRLPARAEKIVVKQLWDLSKHAAGLKIRFKTNARNIVVRYKVKSQRLSRNHFPATGVSGIDLYSLNENGSWAWANGKYVFSDTITYKFSDLNLPGGGDEREYHLYLPLYNILDWIEIGVLERDSFSALPIRTEKPIVVYGTSIAQGATASRPGMAWTAILERSIGVPMINLGFSSNGRLEKEMIDLICEIDAGIFILDCLPNLVNASTPAAAEIVENKIIYAVNTLRKAHPDASIILAEHSGYIDNRLDEVNRKRIMDLNAASGRAFHKLIKDGIKGLYNLPASDFGMGIDGTVDGVHPSDLGMYRYSVAYQQLIESIQANLHKK